MQITNNICNFYKEVVAHQTLLYRPEKNTRKFAAIPWYKFSAGACIATILLIQNLALSIFYAAACLATCGRHKGFRKSLFKNVNNIPVHAGAILLGITGIIIPGVINQKILHLPIEETIQPANVNDRFH